MHSINLNELSPREIQILQLIGEGHNSHEIADQVSLTHNTVCTHRKNILRKTGAKNIIIVVILALQQRVIEVDAMAA